MNYVVNNRAQAWQWIENFSSVEYVFKFRKRDYGWIESLYYKDQERLQQHDLTLLWTQLADCLESI
jgi:hypothetical protein